MNIVKQYIKKNPFSRCGRLRPKTIGIVIHWVANPKTNAIQTGNYFNSLSNQLKNSLKNKNYRYASTHFGIDNERIVQYMPINEVAYNCGSKKYTERAIKKYGYYCEHPSKTSPNEVTVSTELHHPDWEGKPYKRAVEQCIDWAAQMCMFYNLNPFQAIDMHNDVTGKDCPKYYVNNPEQWKWLVSKINNAYEIKRELARMGTWNMMKDYAILNK